MNLAGTTRTTRTWDMRFGLRSDCGRRDLAGRPNSPHARQARISQFLSRRAACAFRQNPDFGHRPQIREPLLSCPAKAGHPVSPGEVIMHLLQVRWLLDHPLSRVVTWIEARVPGQCLSGVPRAANGAAAGRSSGRRQDFRFRRRQIGIHIPAGAFAPVLALTGMLTGGPDRLRPAKQKGSVS